MRRPANSLCTGACRTGVVGREWVGGVGLGGRVEAAGRVAGGRVVGGGVVGGSVDAWVDGGEVGSGTLVAVRGGSAGCAAGSCVPHALSAMSAPQIRGMTRRMCTPRVDVVPFDADTGPAVDRNLRCAPLSVRRT